MTALRVIPGTPELVPFLLARVPASDLAALNGPEGVEALRVSMTDMMGQAARTWCAMDAGGVVFITVAARVEGLSGVLLWSWVTSAVSEHRRDCLVAAHRILDEATAAFGQVTTDVVADRSQLRRAERAGFVVGPLGSAEGPRAAFCRCTRLINQGVTAHG